MAEKEALFQIETERAKAEFLKRQAEFENQQRELHRQLELQKVENEKLMNKKEAQNREQQLLEENVMRVLSNLYSILFIISGTSCNSRS